MKTKKTLEWFQARGNDVPLRGTKFGVIRRMAQDSDSVKTLRDTDAKSDRGIPSTALMGASQNEMEQKYLED